MLPGYLSTAQNISEIQKIFSKKHTSTRFHIGDNQTRYTYVMVPVVMSCSLRPFTDSLISFPWEQNWVTHSLQIIYKSYLAFIYCKLTVTSDLFSFPNYPALCFWCLGFCFSENEDSNFLVWASAVLCVYSIHRHYTIYSYSLYHHLVHTKGLIYHGKRRTVSRELK